ncbi:hypothetical protein ACIQ65_37065, partial [Streptomyces griseofuscus]
PGTPAARRLENIGRFLDFVSESLTRAADQARDVLHTKPGTAPDDPGRPDPERGQDRQPAGTPRTGSGYDRPGTSP